MMDGAIVQSADSRVSDERYGGWAVILAIVVSDGLPALGCHLAPAPVRII